MSRHHRTIMRLEMLATLALGLLGFSTTVNALLRPLHLVRRSDVTDVGHKAEYASVRTLLI